MTTSSRWLKVNGIDVEVVRKAIKNLHLGVYPPEGRVRVAVPLAVSDAAVRVAVIGKLRWIRKQQAAFKHQRRETPREMVAGESHYYLGRRYRLTLVETQGRCDVVLRRSRIMELQMRPTQTAEQRERVLWRWYRERLDVLVPSLLEKWQQKLSVKVASWGVKRMKTKWGSCTSSAKRIWLNRELVKKPPECLEYIVVHELVHLLVRHHDERFLALMDRHLPKWRATKKLLNTRALGHAEWGE
jgi:predicted metal-dependent hydrolase